MHTLIAYATKYGATRECAERIAARLPGKASLADLDSGGAVDLAPYDQVVVGTSIYIGKPRKSAKAFCRRYEKELLQKPLGLFLCCIQDIDKSVRTQMEVAFLKALLTHAKAMEALGGVVDFTKLGKADGIIMNMISGDLRKQTGGDVISTLSDARIDGFCRQLMAK